MTPLSRRPFYPRGATLSSVNIALIQPGVNSMGNVFSPQFPGKGRQLTAPALRGFFIR